MNRGTNSATKDKALGQAVEEIRDRFKQCRGCGNWRCTEVCWNDEVGQCVQCSPIVACPSCGAHVDGGKFCDECGASLQAAKHCTDCGESNDHDAKFCADCGHKFSAA